MTDRLAMTAPMGDPMPTPTPADTLRRIADLLDNHPNVVLHDVQVMIGHLPIVEQHRIAETLRAAGPSYSWPLSGSDNDAVLRVRTGGLANGPVVLYTTPAVAFAEPARDHGQQVAA